jgi:hypothetical protein
MIDEAKLAELKEKHGDIFEVGAPLGEPEGVYVRRLTRLEMRKYMKMREEQAYLTHDSVAVWCTVYPDSAAFDAMLDKFPAYCIPVANAVLEKSGLEAEKVAKKD